MKGREPLLTAGAVALGLLLGLSPFARYRWGAPHAAGHTDHAPRHGGLLGMIGDHHLEVVRRAGRITLHPSDAHRVPLTVRGGRVRSGDGRVELLRATGRARLEGVDPGAGLIACQVELADGTVLSMDVPRAGAMLP
jgi:hypothetical protein